MDFQGSVPQVLQEHLESVFGLECNGVGAGGAELIRGSQESGIAFLLVSGVFGNHLIGGKKFLGRKDVNDNSSWREHVSHLKGRVHRANGAKGRAEASDKEKRLSSDGSAILQSG